jgi:hypothetical protein
LTQCLTSQMGHERRFAWAPAISGLPLTTDVWRDLSIAPLRANRRHRKVAEQRKPPGANSFGVFALNWRRFVLKRGTGVDLKNFDDPPSA